MVSSSADGPVLLVVGLNGGFVPFDENPLIQDDRCVVHFSELSSVTGDLLEVLKPDEVLSPLLGPGPDAIDMLERLRELRFRGRYTALAKELPRPELVLRELRTHAAGIDVQVIDLEELRSRLAP
ncbi:hypothetical protein [Pelagovum pacificum]|uniref:Uncharacterized protein n=1 Tax=Pelagovum pacificum TaxID=2588711 RepID=A0A5C5GBK9_9RHOB|nr:hypothetical protein [Pelagovum pacificum]QQA44759.1 hypothetical protein I8N54_09395 [Pelagovum pacificum]TNY32133.1 hypothetical protein FHY64_02200 [Pelagovum pacificum]